MPINRCAALYFLKAKERLFFVWFFFMNCLANLTRINSVAHKWCFLIKRPILDNFQRMATALGRKRSAFSNNWNSMWNTHKLNLKTPPQGLWMRSSWFQLLNWSCLFMTLEWTIRLIWLRITCTIFVAYAGLSSSNVN